LTVARPAGAPGPGPEAGAGRAEKFADPVFVLCNGRSGSTLLRFILDAHPELACPPETNLPALSAQLATVWSLIEGAPLSATRGDEPPEIPQAAIAGVRSTMDQMVGSYLARRGKQRYCDKSLGTARYAELLRRVYPKARFICMYRHPMDVIASGVEACPWGLNGYGFDPYIAASPGNVVMALANFWADNVRTTLAVEERFDGACFRLRYEDLVADPEATAAAIFEFLGLSAVPGISQACFSTERERFGPGDHKIWYTSAISTDSVGRGWSVPAGMIAPPLLAAVNEMAGRLGYLAVDGDWGTSEPPPDLRLTVASEQAGPDADADATTEERDAGTAVAAPPVTGRALCSQRLGAVLRDGLATAFGTDPARRLGPHPDEKFVVVAVTKGVPHPAEYWLVDLAAATVLPAGHRAQETSDWDVIGTLEAWQQVIDRQVNLSAALRSCELRYCDNGETTHLATDARIRVLGQLLGLASWQ
jgi:protein-tyrosine sulfotransferase